MSKDNRSDEEKVSEYIDKSSSDAYLNEKAEKGIVLLGVLPGSVAERVGLRKHDRILSVDNQAVSSLMDYANLVEKRGSSMNVDIIRGNEFKTFTLHFGKINN